MRHRHIITYEAKYNERLLFLLLSSKCTNVEKIIRGHVNL